MFEEALFVETRVIATWDCDFMVVDAIGSGAIDAEFTRD